MERTDPLFSSLIPAGPWLSPAIISGNTVYLSGLTGQTPDGKYVSGTVQDRTRQILVNAQAQLEHICLALSDSESTDPLSPPSSLLHSPLSSQRLPRSAQDRHHCAISPVLQGHRYTEAELS